MSWKDLEPDEGMLAALQAADESIPRATALVGDRKARHKWSNAFADACAHMIANEVRGHPALAKLHVLPEAGENSEPPTYVAGGKSKRVDVVVSSLVSGLQIGVSLKGMNFRDGNGNQFDKNLTGRTYELQDEVRMIHEYQPASFLVALYFLPIAATVDKRSDTSPSSFARTVEHLRARTGRIDPTLPSQLARADMSVIALYVPGDQEADYADSLKRGIVRYFDVRENPPKRGRPMLGTTMDLCAVVKLITERYRAGATVPIQWAEAEED